MNEETKTILAGMLTENTGRHMLDSGGAYGRNWQRNQTRDFEAESPSTLTFRWGYPEITHNVYSWLAERVTFNPELDARFQEFANSDAMEDEHWLACMEAFKDSLGEDASGIYGDGEPMTVNTYNGEDLLSQTLQYLYWEDEDGSHVLLQIHGGCDVRGGYTMPRAFDCSIEEMSILDNARAAVYCNEDYEKCGAQWFCDDGHSLTYEPSHWPDTSGGKDLKDYALTRDDEPNREFEKADGPAVGSIFVDEDGNGSCPVCGKGTLEAASF
jgi:hypothetical protein